MIHGSERAINVVIAIVGRTITIERAIYKRRKELIPKIKQRAISLQVAIEKNPILLFEYRKNC